MIKPVKNKFDMRYAIIIKIWLEYNSLLFYKLIVIWFILEISLVIPRVLMTMDFVNNLEIYETVHFEQQLAW